ncbi:hypothetical protein MBLNU230_g6542t1 [Neophaeotheca triangularis]
MERSSGLAARCWRCTKHDRILAIAHRSFSSTATSNLETETQGSSNDSASADLPKLLDPNLVVGKQNERRLVKRQHINPLGSRRRRAALNVSPGIPFEQLPYQAFQEARKFLQEDRKEKLEEIQKQRTRIHQLEQQEVGVQNENSKQHRLDSMRRRLEETKILADINDPVVKKKFEDGLGDMDKPIYRHLADKKWRNYKRQVLMQRINTMNVVPDVLPNIDPIVSTSLTFRRRRVQHGDKVDSRVSEGPPVLNVQSFDKGEKLVTIAVINPDVPEVGKDGFTYRCHFLASNITISPTKTSIHFGNVNEASQQLLPWLPAFAQKGLDYQRMSVVVLEQPSQISIETIKATGVWSSYKGRERTMTRDGFNLQSFADVFDLTPIGVDLFRTEWDEGTAGVMERAGVPGADVEFRRKKIEPLPYQKLPGSRFR